MSETDDTPDTLGRYELLTKFATGGMAELFLARERGVGGLERVVVIKRLLPHLTDDTDSVNMFLREARLVARLNHPNVVQTYELGEAGGDFYLAMEYLHGSTLRELTTLTDERGEELPLAVAVSAAEQACRGLHAAHELKDLEGNPVELIHRDVSPQNLMCTDEGYVKLLDFGVAKAAEGKEATYSGNIKGKFSYMSPEQLQRDPLDRRSDIFAMGVVIWELCTGQRLFKRDSELETMQAITEEEAPSAAEVNPEVPARLAELLDRSLAKNREDRFQTVEAMRQELVEIAEDHDLMMTEGELADFVDRVAGERLDARRETLQEALERSLTSDERAQFRHGDRLGTVPGDDDDQTAVERPGHPFGESAGTAPGGELGNASSSSVHRAQAPSQTTARVDREEEGSDQAADDHNRRLQIGLTSAALLLLAASVGFTLWGPRKNDEGAESNAEAEPAAVEVSGEPITFGVAPLATRSVLEEELGPIERYLEQQIGRPIDFVIANTYVDASTKLRDGEYDLGFMTPLLYVRTRRAEPRVRALAVREFDGAITSDGLLLILSDAKIQRLEDLRGETFCFTDKNSTTGNFLPRAHLRRRGWEPREFIGKVHWSGNHLQVLKDLEAGKCAAAATYSGSLLTADEHGLSVGRFRTLAITGHGPSDTMTARPGLPDELANRFQEAFLKFDPQKHSGTKAIGETLQITGFRKPQPELYESLEQAVEQNQDILERFGFPGVEKPEESKDAGDAGDAGDADSG